ncbi:LamG-like jellyroll fold domain-containing protein [Hwangdonia lutea]|uniref:LamG-like jellyroll fold domain-containing protein n=1 Tax=Hwangdonia lutea TaxID=3075823 RepID=A0AA97EJZ1_9FLAO|nr:LamG-like jellyroll fold domain-containing protein [Hwangdonia sp. SCSIO 19198]WOD42642.1 LamG-like jellyroll fold domain-containing protein [Hwangdonia sp. SCSIO 19198]
MNHITLLSAFICEILKFLNKQHPKWAFILLFAIIGFNSIGMHSQAPANDNFVNATLVTHTSNWCSADAQYTTINATPDGVKGTAWNNGPNYNVWFKFQATTTQVNAQISMGGSLGNMRFPFLALWDNSGTEITSATHYSSRSSLNVQSDNLTIGNWYYISVDNHNSASYRGSFSLCIDDEVNYDYMEKAVVVPHTSNWCSADAEYTTINGSPDGVKGTAWNNGPNYNVWFKFQATTTEVNAQLSMGGGLGTMRYPFLALWDNSGTEITSATHYSSRSSLNVQSDNLTIGNWYYISVDNHNSASYRGSFSLCIDDEVNYDYMEEAVVVPHTSNWCSADAEYTTINASPDGVKGAAWNNGPNYNVWFKFQATTTEVNAQISMGGSLGTMRYPFLALWDGSGTEITSATNYGSRSSINVQSDNLTIGDWYYISVDNHNSASYRGSFSLCIDDVVNNDYKEEAVIVPHTSNWCSADAEYTTINASPDGLKGAAWNNGPNYNVWFKFQATTTEVNAQISMGGSLGTMRYPFLALWDSSGTEITSATNYSSRSSINVQSDNLTIGDWYYISVDNHKGASYRGSFSLCIDDVVNNDYKEEAVVVPHTSNWCSADAEYTTINASPDGLKGAAWKNGPNYNVWYKFQATTTQVNAQISMGGSLGTMRYPFLALWDNSGTEITSATYYSSRSSINVQSANLTIGNWYYISVDNHVGASYRGSFSLCVDDKVDYDFYEAAIDVTSLINSCSADALYTTIGASPDRNKGSNWNNNGPKKNRWFKFTAPATGQVNITVDIGGSKGTQRATQIALWEADGLTEVKSSRYTSTNDDVILSANSLTSGDTYYISVDVYSGHEGTFTLCIENTFVDFDGVSSYVDFGNNHNFNGSFSLEAWIFQKSNASTATVISKGDAKAGAPRGYHLSIKNGFPNLTWYNNSGTEILNITSPHQITNNIWHHVASSYNGTTASLYLDGVLVASSNSSRPSNNNRKFMLGATYDSSTPSTPKHYFNGYIDEVRVWNVALNERQLREMMNQEITQNGTAVKGQVTPSNISNNLLWSSLKGYYPMTNSTPADHSSQKIHGISKNNTSSIQLQTAPLPYKSAAHGDWETTSTWLNNSVQYIPNSRLYGTQIDWNIIVTNHNLEINRNTTVVGLIVASNEIKVNGTTVLSTGVGTGNGLFVSKYLKLDGKLDLQGESQLIQSEGSVLEVASSGAVERDQQGTKDFYTYNYWSSPVGIRNTTSNNNSYTLADVLNDGTVPTAPLPITFVSGHNGTPGSAGITPIGIASTWIWKYANKLTDNYASWQHVKNTGTILAGEGYTMKGVENSASSFTEKQNYVFNGKPNNGDITLTLSAGNDYLVGNPYASAIDANEFILDNISDGAGRASNNIIDGTLYFWDHFAGNTHVLHEYQGGYATYTLMGGIKAVSTDARINASGKAGTKVPKQFIPVSQGFFVTADAGGTVTFKNSQRIFKTEASNPSLFVKGTKSKGKSISAETDLDERQKIRLMLNSPKGYHRQLLVGVDENATNGIDKGYDAPLIEDNVEDLFWVFSNKNFVIQAVDNFDDNQILPLGIKIAQEGLASIEIDELENIDNSKAIYLHDKALDVYHDLNEKPYEVHLAVGQYLNRFDIRFSKSSQSLSTDEAHKKSIEVYFSNEEDQIIVHNPNAQLIESVEMINILGQSLFKFEISSNDNYLKYKASQIKTGTYILKIKTEHGELSKKVLIK